MEQIETTGIRTQIGWRTHWRRLAGLQWKDIRIIAEEVVNSWSEHRVPRLGASVAFYTLLSLAPLLIIIVAIVGAVFGKEAAEGQLVWQIQDLVGRAGAETVQNLLRTTQQPGAGIIASLFGAIALILGATTAVSELRDALNTIWCVPKKQTTTLQSIVSMVRERGLALATVIAVGFLFILLLAANTTISALTSRYHT